MNKGIDRATPLTNQDCKILIDNDYTFVIRYLSKSSWKRLEIEELKRLSKHGLYTVVVYQDSNNNHNLFNFDMGYNHGREALRQAIGLGIPENTPIYFAVDFNPTNQSHFSNIENYFLGIEKALYWSKYKIGVYGSYSVIEHMQGTNKDVEYFWQTYAWSYGKVSNYNLYQYRNDINLPEDDRLKSVDLNLSNGNGGGFMI